MRFNYLNVKEKLNFIIDILINLLIYILMFINIKIVKKIKINMI